MLHQSICAVGRMIVLAGAIWKGRGEYNEMMNLGVKKYFQTTVKFRFYSLKKFTFFYSTGFRSS
jgi:hypothetical protein